MKSKDEIKKLIAKHNLGISVEDYLGMAEYYSEDEIIAAFKYEKSTDVEERSRIAEALLKHRESRDAKRDKMYYSRGMMKNSLSLEMLESNDEVKCFSDDGAGVERLIEKLDAELEKLSETRKRRINSFRMCLERNKAKKAIRTLYLLVVNGKDRGKTIRTLAKIKGINYDMAKLCYWRDLHKMESILKAKFCTSEKS